MGLPADPPRVTLRHLFRSVTAWLAGFFLLCGLLVGVITLVLSTEARLLAAEGITTTGTVIGRDEVRRRSDSGTYHYSYFLVVRFQTADGTAAQTRLQVQRARYDAEATGASVTLRYAASDPTVTEFEAGDTAFLARVLSILTGVVVLAGLYCAWAALRVFRAMRRAAQGERRTAQVIALHKVGKASAETYSMEWNDGSNTGRTAPMRRDTLPALGERIPVFIDPRSGKGWWAGEF